MEPRRHGWAGPPVSDSFEDQLNDAMAIIEASLDALEMHLRHRKRLRRRAATASVLSALCALQQRLEAGPRSRVPKALPGGISAAMLAVADPVEVLLTNWKRIDHDDRIRFIIDATSSAAVLRNAVNHVRAERQIRPLAM